MTARPPTIQAVLYTNPDRVPPIINSARVLASSGFKVDMICRQYKREWNIDYPPDVRIRRVAKDGASGWRELVNFIFQAIRLSERSASVIVGHEMHGFLAARILASIRRRPLVYHCHDFVESSRHVSRGARLVRAFERRFARTADMVIVPDAERAQVMVRELRLSRPPVIVANAPLNINRHSGDELRQAVQSAGKPFTRIVLRHGTIGPGHAIEATIRSIPFWTDPSWGFVLLGFGSPEYLAELEHLTRSLRVEDRVAVLPPVSYDRIPLFTPGADIGHALYDPVNVNHVFMGTASNKLMEFMAAAVPVLVPETEQYCSFLKRYGCGVAVDVSSPHQIAAAVNGLLSDGPRRSALGRAGADAFEHTFSYDRQFAPALARIRQLARSAETANG